jgi:hypothetical protein
LGLRIFGGPTSCGTWSRHRPIGVRPWRPTPRLKSSRLRGTLPRWRPNTARYSAYYSRSAKVALPAGTYAVRLSGTGSTVSLVDEVSFQAWDRRRILALRLSLWSVAVLTMIFGTLYKGFFETRVTPSGALLMLTILVYLPVRYHLACRDASVLEGPSAFPTVDQSVLTIR